MSEENNVKEEKKIMKKGKKEKSSGKPKKKWLIVLVVIVVVIAFLGSVIKNMTSQVELAMNTIEIEPVQYRDLSDSISIKGTISGESRTNVVSEASAEVTEVNVQVGDIVNAGDLLAVLDQTDIEKQISDTATELTNAQAVAKNQADQTAESLGEAKEDQNNSLTKASKAVEQAQADYDEIKKKNDECSSRLEKKKEELLAAGGKSLDCKNAFDAATVVYQAAAAAYQAEPENTQLKAEAEHAAAELESRKTEFADAAENYSRIEAELTSLQAQADSYKQSLKSAQNVIDTANENYQDTLTATNRSVAAAQNQVDMSRYQSDSSASLKDQLDTLKRQLEDCSLVAPCSGVVTAVNVSVGDKYAAGQTMITIEDTSKLKVVVTVEEADILKIEEGMSAVITTDAIGDQEIKGTVTRVVRVKNQSANAMESASAGYSAEISIDDTNLLIGMSAKAKIILKEKGNVLAVPYDLIRYDEDGNAFVLTAMANDDGTATAVRKNIIVGEEVDYYTEVIGGDLKEGDRLIYDDTYSVTEGQIFTPEQMYSEQDMEFGTTGVEAE